MKKIIILFLLSFLLFGQNLSKIDSLLANKKGKIKVGLVLSGGGAKGFIHVGALKTIEKSGLKIDYIGGTSMGAFVGALYSVGYSPYEIDSIFKKTSFDFLSVNNNRRFFSLFKKKNEEKFIVKLPITKKNGIGIPQSINKGEKFQDLTSELLNRADDITDFSKLPIPFYCLATNLETGKEKIIESGHLSKSIMASTAIPSFLPPAQINDSLYVDGAVVNNFPTKVMNSKEMDIIIGINLGQPLYKKNEMTSIPTIIDQISSYISIKNTTEQLKYADILISPDISKFSATDFDLKNELIDFGETETKNFYELFYKIAQHNKAFEKDENKSSQIKFLPKKDVIFLESIKINGLNKTSESYVLNNLGLFSPQITSYKYIQERINFLYASDLFEKLFYKIQTKPNGRSELQIEVEENEITSYFKLGLHYDPVFKSAALINYSNNQFLLKNGLFSVDIILGDFPRYNINYFIDNGRFPSIGFNSSFKSANLNRNFNQNELVFLASEFKNQLFVQTAFENVVELTAGLEYNYLSIKNKTDINNFNISEVIQSAYFFSPYATIRADTKNNNDFPSKGIFFDGIFQYLLFSNSSNLKPVPYFDGNVEFYYPLTKSNKLSANFKSSVGLFFDENITPIGYEFNVGSLFKQNYLNAKAYSGLELGNYSGSYKTMFQAGLQYELFPNQFFGLSAMTLNLSNAIDAMQWIPNNHFSIETSYGLQTFFGPIKGFYTYNLSDDQAFFGFNIGYWF